jgi:hypothetical protein
LFAAATAAEFTHFRLTTRDGPVFYYPGLTPRIYINVTGVPCREPDSDWKSDVIPALALVSC